MDGGTVIHFKWIALGYLSQTAYGIRYQVLDVELFEKRCTTENLHDSLSKIVDDLKKYKCTIVGACTDNASNFVKVFMTNEDDDDQELSDFDITPLGIIRVSCCCHTIQLALKDLYDYDEYFRELTDILKMIPHKLKYMSRHNIEELGLTSYPPIQSQRWNSIFISLQYVVSNIDAIIQLFDESSAPILHMEDLLQLKAELEPIYTFTTICEGDRVNQAQLYLAYRGLEASLESCGTERSTKLLEFVQSRFSSTADIDVARLCFFTTNAGIIEKRETFPHVTEEEAMHDADSAALLDNELGFIDSFSQILEKLARKLELDSGVIKELFKNMMQNYTPQNAYIHKYPKSIDLRKHFNGSEPLQSYIMFAYFINALQVLPASEAGAERIFARMRDVYNPKQTRLSPESLRTNLVLSFFAEESRRESDM